MNAVVFSYTCSCRIHTDAMNNRQVKTSLTKYTSHFICKGLKRVTQGLRVRGSWRLIRNCNILTPTLMAVNIVSFSFSRAAQPEAQQPSSLLDDGFLYCILSATLWSPNSIGVPEGPFGQVWFSLPHLVYDSVQALTGTPTLTSVLTELYNSSTPTQSPTRSLEWHDWSSSSRNNCHAVHRSLSSGASVYECTMGIFFTSSHFISQFPPTRFPLITAIRMCHFLPVHHLGMAFLAGSKVKIQHAGFPESMSDCLKWLAMELRHTWPDPYIREHSQPKCVSAKWARTASQKENTDPVLFLNWSWIFILLYTHSETSSQSKPK